MNLKEIGTEAILAEDFKAVNSLPVVPWDDFPLFFTAEYSTNDFEAEIGFWAEIMGMEFLSLSKDYAIVKHPDYSWTFSIKKAENPFSGTLKFQIYTDLLADVLVYVEEKGYAYTVEKASENQRYISLRTPAGLTLEIWSGWEE